MGATVLNDDGEYIALYAMPQFPVALLHFKLPVVLLILWGFPQRGKIVGGLNLRHTDEVLFEIVNILCVPDCDMYLLEITSHLLLVLRVGVFGF